MIDCSHAAVMDYDEAYVSCILLVRWSATSQRLKVNRISVSYALMIQDSYLKIIEGGGGVGGATMRTLQSLVSMIGTTITTPGRCERSAQ